MTDAEWAYHRDRATANLPNALTPEWTPTKPPQRESKNPERLSKAEKKRARKAAQRARLAPASTGEQHG